MNKKDIKEYHKMIKKLEKEKKYGQQENEELEESYKESRRQQKERQSKGPFDSFSDDLKNSIKKRNEMIKKVGKIKS